MWWCAAWIYPYIGAGYSLDILYKLESNVLQLKGTGTDLEATNHSKWVFTSPQLASG